MTVQRKTQKDVGKFEHKFVGPFTTTQCIFAGIGIVLGVTIKFLLDGLGIDNAVSIMAAILFSAFGFVVGTKKIQGMSMLEYLKVYRDTCVNNPKKRLYKTVTDIDAYVELEKKKKEKEALQSGKKKPEVKKTHKSFKEYPEYL